MIPESVRWRLFRRRQYSKVLIGFKAHFFTYATPDCTFDEYVNIHRDSELFSCHLGRATYIAGASLSNVTTGRFCSIGQGARIGLGGHPSNFLSTHPAFYSNGTQTLLHIAASSAFEESSSVVLGNDVWIGANTLIMGGIKVGDGAIIGAGAVVTKDIPAYAIAVGCPAKVIRYRFDEPTIGRLLALQWWNKPDQEIRNLARLISPEGPIDSLELERWMDTQSP